MFKKLNLVAACAVAVVLAGCGGGAAVNSAAEAYTVDSGVAQKGPLAQGSAIWINELAATTYKPNGKEYTFRTSNNLGTFAPNGTKYSTPYLSTLAQGYYYNEITGTQSADVVLLSGLSQIGKVGTVVADTAINVNVLSSMAVNRTLSLAATKPVLTFAAARAQAQKDTLGAFYIYNGAAILTGATVGSVVQPANLTALDLSKSRAGDQMLAAISGVVMQAGVNGAGVNALLSQAANDLGDDGLLNNSTNYTPSVQSQLCAAAAVTDFGAVAANLNRVYGTSYSSTDLSQWIDTSGCVDQVINKYKFSASNVVAGTESKSPAYIAGPDDVGQCFSVGGVSAGATATLYYQGSTTGVVGTQKAALGDSLSVGVTAGSAGTYSAFMQRSSPSATGVCPTTVSASGLVRIQKYKVNVASSTLNLGTVSGINLNLINPQTINGKIYYFLDQNGNGQADCVGTNPDDQVDHLKINDFFNNGSPTIATQINGAVAGVTDARSRVINGYTVVLPNRAELYSIRQALNYTAPNGWAFQNGAGATAFLCNFASADSAGTTVVNGIPRGIHYNTGMSTTNDFTNLYDGYGYNSLVLIQIIPPAPAGTVTVSTLAGSGAQGSADGAGANATFWLPTSLAVDANGNVYVADTYSDKIRKITTAGVVSTLAGSGALGSADGVGSSATFNMPYGIAADLNGNVYVADTFNNNIRKITQQ